MQKDKILNHLINKNGLCPRGIDIFNESKNDINKIISASIKWVELFIEHENAIKMLEFLSEEEVKLFAEKGVFLNQKVNLVNPDLETIILLGNSEADIQIKDFGVVQIYVLNDSKLNLKSSDFSIVYIDSHHRANVKIKKKDKIKAESLVTSRTPIIIVKRD
mgnify:CR=1 FL=1